MKKIFSILKNDNLDDESVDEKKAISNAQALKKTFSVTEGIFIDAIKLYGRLQLKQLLIEYKNVCWFFIFNFLIFYLVLNTVHSSRFL
jgi:hypothetical protein